MLTETTKPPCGPQCCTYPCEDAEADGRSWSPHKREPRQWSLPAEPGPEVTAVRAAQSHYGMTLWVREPLAWNLRRADGKLLVSCTKWLRLLQRYGPLTDATGETP